MEQKKLSLKKETIATLSNDEQTKVAGGASGGTVCQTDAGVTCNTFGGDEWNCISAIKQTCFCTGGGDDTHVSCPCGGSTPDSCFTECCGWTA